MAAGMADHAEGEHVTHERKSANQEPVLGADFAQLLGAADKIVAVCDDSPLLTKLEQAVSAAVGSAATVGRSQTYYLDITALSANKGDGVTALAAAMGVPLANVAVIGDQHNDLPMFTRAGISIAMGQGPKDVRAAAMRVCGSNDEDGVAQAIDDILLPLVKPKN